MKLGVHLNSNGLTDGLDPHPVADIYNVAELTATAKLAEEALFDALFRADSPSFDKNLMRWGSRVNFASDAIIALSSVVAATSRIGLVTTSSSTFNHPYNLARQFLTLDQLSRGRVGWNVVTSSAGERQFGLTELPPQELRYKRAAEFLDIVHALWDSWRPESLERDENGRTTVHPEHIHEIDYEGDYLSVAGALGIPRSIQGRPVQFQAGASDTGKPFAVKYADAIYSASPYFEHGQAIYAEFRRLAAQHRSAPGVPLIFPGFMLTTDATHDEALERYRARFTDEILNEARTTLSNQFGGIDLDGIDLDETIPESRLPDIDTLVRRQSRPRLFSDLARRGLTLRQILEQHISGNGHYSYAGSYDEVADELERWFNGGAADGFLLAFLGGKADLLKFIEHVLPRLQSRGLFRTKYEAETLRGNLGLEFPGERAAA